MVNNQSPMMMKTATIILAILAFVSMMYFLFFSDVNRDLGYASLLLLLAINAYFYLIGNKGKGTDRKHH